MTLEPGVKLGPYEILAPLGAGGMGEVWRARDPRLGRDVAVKVLPEEFFESEERKRRFEREARLLAALNHPGIAAIYSFEEIPGSSPRHILVMELLEGETLRDRLRAGPLPLRKAVDVAVQMAKALAAAHERGIVHRDLKPENVFLGKGDRVKVFDFGLAKLSRREEVAEAETESALTEAGAVFGTVGYMSPEQVRGEPVDHRSDIFSLGTIVHEMLSGTNPFRAPTAPESMTAILKAEAQLPEGVSPGLARIVTRCLEKGPDERFQSSRDLAFALEGLTSGLAAASPAAVRLSPTVGFLVAAAFLVAVAGGYLIGTRTKRAEPPAFKRLTFRRGHVNEARFAPDGQTILYGATWEGNPAQVFTTRPGIPEASPLALPAALLLGISSKGDLALSLKPRYIGYTWHGTLGRAPMTGGAPREITEGALEADWSASGAELAVVRRPTNRQSGSVLELPPGKPLLESAGRIAQPRISPKGDLVALLDHPVWDDAGSVAVVDRAGKKSTLSTGWLNARGLAWSPSGDEIWFTASKTGRDQSLYAVTLSGKERLVARLGGSWILHDIAPDGRALLSRNDTRLGITGSFPAGERDLSWFDWSRIADLSPDGERILFTEFGEGAGAKYLAYLRRTDGSPAVRLGEGVALALSPDGRWALVVRGSPAEFVALPTGSGEERALPRGNVVFQAGLSSFFPDGRRFLFPGKDQGGREGLFIQDIEGGLPQPFGPDGLEEPRVSPDGRWVASWSEKEKKVILLTAQGDRGRSIDLGAPEPDRFQWSADGRSLLTTRVERSLVRVHRVDVSSGVRQTVREIRVPAQAGTLSQSFVLLAQDGKSYALGYLNALNDLYLVEGLR